MQIPLSYLDASAIEEITIDAWRELFDATGYPASLQPNTGAFTHGDVLVALVQDELTDELLQAIEAIDSLGTEAGRDAIVSAMNDRRVSADALPSDAGEREIALRLFLAQRDNAAMVEVFARAAAQVQETANHRRYNEFMGAEARTVDRLKARSDAFSDAIRRYCKDNDLGDHVQVRAFEDDGIHVFSVIRSHHTKKPLAIIPGRTARATIQYRPVHGDIIRYDTGVGRLRIAARAATMVEFYRKTLGHVLFDDDSFFTDEPVCTLEVLQRIGREALSRHDICGIGRVRMTECLWERGDRDLVHLRSSDCFRSIGEMRLPLSQGTIIQAKLKLDVASRSARPVTVTIRVPGRIEISNKLYEQIVDDYLTAIQIRNVRETARATDLWSLDPWRHPVASWRSVFGASTDALVRAQVLTPVRLESVPSAEHAAAERGIRAQPLPGGEFYGVSSAPEVPSRTLSPTDLDALELNPEAMRSHIRTQLQLSGTSSTWDGDDLLDLGGLPIGEHEFRLFYALRPPRAGSGDRMRLRAAGAHAVLLIPSPIAQPSDLPTMMIDSALPDRASLSRNIVTRFGLSDQVPALITAPNNARLVVDTRIGKIWIDGVEILNLRRETHPFRFVEELAKASPTPVSMATLSAQLSGARRDGDTAARQAKNETRKCIGIAMSSCGRAFDEDPFPSGPTGHYRCVLIAYVR